MDSCCDWDRVQCVAGYFVLGVSDAPNEWIVVGGSTILIATIIVTVSQFLRQAQEREGLSKRSHSLEVPDSPGLAIDIGHFSI